MGLQSKILVLCIIILQFFSLTRRFWIEIADIDMFFFTISSYLGYSFTLILSIINVKNIKFWFYLIIFVLFFAAIGIFTGLNNGFYLSYFIEDICTITSIIFYYKLFQFPEIRFYFSSYLSKIVPIVILLLVYSTTRIVIDSNDELDFSSGDRIARQLLSYKIQYVAFFWTILLFDARLSIRNNGLLLGFVLLVLQIFYQKRAPTIHILLFIIVFLFYNKNEYFNSIKYYVILVISFLILLIYSDSIGLSSQFFSLMERFSGQVDKNQIYDSGVMGNFSTENERYDEVRLLHENKELLSLIFGNGFGAFYENNSSLLFGSPQKDFNSIERVISYSPHVGLFYLVLKFGYIGLFMFLFFVIYKIYSSKGISRFFLLISLVFLFIEGFYTFTSHFFELLFLSFILNETSILHPKIYS